MQLGEEECDGAKLQELNSIAVDLMDISLTLTIFWNAYIHQRAS